MEQYLSDGADMNYEHIVSSDYYCTDEDDNYSIKVAQFISVQLCNVRTL